MDSHKNFGYIVSTISILLFTALACRAISEGELSPECTPPDCARNEVYFCYDECPGGCGTSCAMFTPAPHPMYTSVDLVGVNFSNSTLEISMDIPGIQGDFYGVISSEDFECGIWQPEQNPERLFCKGTIWSIDSEQTLRVYRTGDNEQAFTIDFTVP